MDKLNEVRKLGFESFDEMLLYKDVCADRDINPPETLEELLTSLESEITNKENTKQEYYNFIKNNGLLELFNKVKDMSLFNRMVEIYIYNANGLSLCTKIEKLYSEEIEKAKELYLSETEKEYKSKLERIRRLHSEYSNGMSYIEKEVKQRLPKEEINFYEATNNITKEAHKTNYDEYSKEI